MANMHLSAALGAVMDDLDIGPARREQGPGIGICGGRGGGAEQEQAALSRFQHLCPPDPATDVQPGVGRSVAIPDREGLRNGWFGSHSVARAWWLLSGHALV